MYTEGYTTKQEWSGGRRGVFHHHDERIDALRKIEIFRGLGRHQLKEIARVVDEVHTEAGQVLVRQGEMGHEFALLVEGRARVERDGRTIATLESGDFFGEMSLLDGKPRSATIISETPSTIMVMHGRDFGFLLDSVPGLAKQMLVELVARLRQLEARYLQEL
jgi:CRP-like cAMP-binding protein